LEPKEPHGRRNQKQKVLRNKSQFKTGTGSIHRNRTACHADGWVPKDEWDGDPEQWRPAKEFVDRGELFKKIEIKIRTILKSLNELLRTLANIMLKSAKWNIKRALTDLKAQKKDAIRAW
jgi:hypothetical protein